MGIRRFLPVVQASRLHEVSSVLRAGETPALRGHPAYFGPVWAFWQLLLATRRRIEENHDKVIGSGAGSEVLHDKHTMVVVRALAGRLAGRRGGAARGEARRARPLQGWLLHRWQGQADARSHDLGLGER